MYEINWNGEVVRSIENQKPARYENVHVYAGDPWSPALGADVAAAGYIRKLKISTGSEISMNSNRIMWPGKFPTDFVEKLMKIWNQHFFPF